METQCATRSYNSDCALNSALARTVSLVQQSLDIDVLNTHVKYIFECI